MTDATFEEGQERPLRLIARDADDLQVISALVQDAVLTGVDLRYDAQQRRFSLLLNRFRWEDRPKAEARGTGFERARAILDFADVRTVRHQGLSERDADTVLSLLALRWEPAPDVPDTPAETDAAAEADAPAETKVPAGPGRILLVFSGDGAISLDVECLEVQLCDVTRPYVAPSRRAPDHPID
ncbi:DUF2948 family protein [Pararhodobacter sp. SW119]|uniref:DUF2948 family protein n=1 Tax=Pararhodobacter sp. SW119 TaxID=2780075 RepID=UPI001AE0DD19|nr:DUF2948 family protein [Pararhodobacter sp. SW119]